MTEQPENGINTLTDDGLVWVDLTCGASHGGMCNVGVASAKTKGAALRRAAKRLRAIADQCEEISKANDQSSATDEALSLHYLEGDYFGEETTKEAYEFARELERELDRARAEAERWRDNWKNGRTMSMIVSTELPWEND